MRRFLDYLSYAGNLVSIPLTIYLYFLSVQERIPTYYVSPERTRIIDTSIPAPSELQVLYKGKDLRANVSALIVYVWNDGRMPIKAEDILDPLRIELDPPSEILDARLLKVSRQVTKFAKGEMRDASKNSIPISFSILEHGDGAAIQIIYTGDPDAQAKMFGVIVGASRVRAITTAQPKRKEALSLLRKVVPIAMFTLMAMVMGMSSYQLFYRRKTQLPWGSRDYIYVATIFLYLGMAVYVGYDTYHRFEGVVPKLIWAEQ